MAPVFEALRAEGPLEQEIWDFTYPEPRKTWNQGVVANELAPMVTYQVRHSAPSWERLHRRRSQTEIGKRGRWKTARSIARYEKHGQVTQTYHRIPILQRTFYEKCAKQLKDIVLRRSLPLSLPWNATT